jgi:hypothetical protein
MMTKKSHKPADASDSDPVLLPVPDVHPNCDHGKVHVVREYRNADGQLLFYQVRYLKYDRKGNLIVTSKGTPDKIDRYRVLRKTISGALYWDWEWGLIPRPRPLYRSQYLPLNPGAPVMVCEGEKAAEAASELFINHVSLSWMGGASSAKHADWKQLAGRHVTIFRDHDESGLQAAKDACKALVNCAASVSVINLETLARHLGHVLKKGYDADDLRHADGWDHESMARFLADPAALQPATDFTGDDDAAPHRALIEAIEGYLRSEGVTMNAAGQWSGTDDYRPLPRTSIVSLSHSFAYHYRNRSRVASAMVSETMSVIGSHMASARRDSLVGAITGFPADPAGMTELVKFVNAVVGSDDIVVLHGLRHWIWLVKRTMCGMTRAWDLMPVFYGRQRGGKSTAVAKLCSPLQELVSSIQSTILTDDRAAPILGRFYVGIWDELEGIGRAETEAIKNAITCTTKMHRVLGSHESGTVVRIMNFIGTSNKPIGQVMRDTTGLGRFMQAECLPVLDWKTINKIDYSLLWRCVSEDDEPPVKLVADELASEQEIARHKDNVSLWLEQETWERLVWEPVIGGGQIIVTEYSAEIGETCEEIRSRYVHWCRTNSEPPVAENLQFQRLHEEGFVQWRPRVADRKRRYRRPGDAKRSE